jgi:DNA repair exonuclease SbcCD ATPase subunit
VQVRRKRTFDAGATPDLGDYERPELKSVGSDLVDELEEISQREERRQDRITELETEVERLESEKADLREELEDARDMTDMAQQFTEAMMQSEGGDGATSEKVDELVEERNELRRDLESRDDRIEALEQRVSELQRYEERVEQLDALDIGEAEEALERLQEALNIAADGEAAKYREKLQNARARIEELEADEEEPPEPDVVEHPAVRRQVSNIKSTVDDLDEKALKMLEWYRYYGPGEAGDAYFHAGGKRSSRRRYDHNKPLREAGLIEKDGQGIYRYAAPDRVREQFEDNPQVDEDAVEALIGEIEAKIEEVTPTDE